MDLKILFFALLAIIFSVFGCKNSQKKEIDVNGEYIKEIKADTIYTETGKSLVLGKDSIEKVFYLFRHAEKDTIPVDNPNLTQQGLDRSTKLADILRGTRVDAIYSTFFTRTLFTVDSLSDVKAMSVLPYDTKELKNLVQTIETDDEKNAIVIVGHSNSIPSLTNSLAKAEIFNSNWDEADYDNFIIVVFYQSGSKNVYKLKYKPN